MLIVVHLLMVMGVGEALTDSINTIMMRKGVFIVVPDLMEMVVYRLLPEGMFTAVAPTNAGGVEQLKGAWVALIVQQVNTRNKM